MRILLINDYGIPAGGGEIGALLLRDGLRARGHDARLFSSSVTLPNTDNLADYQCHGSSHRSRLLLQTANPWAALRLRRIIKDFRPQVVYVRVFLTQMSPLILPLLRQIPSVYHVVWYRPLCPLGTKLLPDGSRCQSMAGKACHDNHCLPLRDLLPLTVQSSLWQRWRGVFDAFVANSHALKNRLEAEGIEPVQVIWNGVPVRHPRPQLEGPPTVVFAGRLVREKGVDILLRAFAQVVTLLPEARLLIAGSGPQEPQLTRLIQDLNLVPHVVMLGQLGRRELERTFDAAWVQAVPSVWDEPFGIVAAEALMRGTAVVASRSGGLPEIVQDGRSGLLVAPGDPQALAESLVKLLSEQALAEKMGRAGREVAIAKFGQDTYVDRFLEIYEGLLENRAAGLYEDQRIGMGGVAV